MSSFSEHMKKWLLDYMAQGGKAFIDLSHGAPMTGDHFTVLPHNGYTTGGPPDDVARAKAAGIHPIEQAHRDAIAARRW